MITLPVSKAVFEVKIMDGRLGKTLQNESSLDERRSKAKHS